MVNQFPPYRSKKLHEDPILNFYAHELGLSDDQLPESFPEENKDAFFRLLNILNDREKFLMISFYGLEGKPCKTMTQLSTEVQPPVNKSRIGEIIQKAARKLRGERTQLLILLRPRAYYMQKVEETQRERLKIQKELCADPRTEELLSHIARASELLAELENSEINKRLSENLEVITGKLKELAVLENPEVKTPRILGIESFNILEDMKPYIEKFSECSNWIKDGKIVTDDYIKAARGANITQILEDDSLDVLNLSARSYNWLKRGGIHTISQLSALTIADLKQFRNLGKRSLDEVVQACARIGIILQEK